MQKKVFRKPYEKSQLRQIELKPEAVLAPPCKPVSGRTTNKCECILVSAIAS